MRLHCVRALGTTQPFRAHNRTGPARASLMVPVLAALLSSCASQGSSSLLERGLPAPAVSLPAGNPTGRDRVGLGKVLTSAYGGQIFGFDVDQHGIDGLVSEYAFSSYKASIETFNTTTGKITKIVKTISGSSIKGNSFATFGIVGNDVGFVDEERGGLTRPRDDKFLLLNPNADKKITGRWRPPDDRGSVLYQQAVNQTTNTQVSIVFRNALGSDVPWIYVWDSATNKFMNFIQLAYTGEAIAEESQTDEAVLAGQNGYGAPINTLVNLKTKKIVVFPGYNNGFSGAGAVNGLAVDSQTGTAATDTELNSQVEFYDLKKRTGITYVQLPCTSSADQGNSGSGIVNDAVHSLFLVTEEFYACNTNEGSAVLVYDESGNLVETITGFKFFLSEPAPAIDPRKRIGWTFGPGLNQLQQFFY
jgi:hypothetical protein